MRLADLSPARRAALGFAAAHLVVCAAGLVEPRAYGLALGVDGGRRGRLRLLAAADAAFAGAVAEAVVGGRPLRTRLRVGAASDLGRAVALAGLFDGAPRSRLALGAASLAGASAATWLSTRVD